jgi:hypothetical protein
LRLLLSDDGEKFRQVYEHDGSVFLGFQDQKPLVISLTNETTCWVRLALPGQDYFHLDEVEVFGSAQSRENLALGRPADQSSVSLWSVAHQTAIPEPDWTARTRETLALCERLASDVARVSKPAVSQIPKSATASKTPNARKLRDPAGLKTGDTADAEVCATTIARLKQKLAALPAGQSARPIFLEARRLQRRFALQNPLLHSFDTLLFTKRVPPTFNHMSDQFYGWWSQPGGGIFLLRGFAGGSPVERCLTDSFKEPGSFLRPTLSYDATKVLFAWCRHYPHLAAETNKLDKANVPEDAFYHLYEMNLDGSDVRQLTRGKYDDFDGRYLPDGRIVFLSTRRGQALQVGRQSASRSLARPDLPDAYVRCGGGPERPVAVYTLHTLDAAGGNLCALSPFEMFEWTPEIAGDGSIIYSRWDYVDRDNMPYMGLWTINPDGTAARAIFKNYTKAPHCVFEAKPVPGSHKLVFTASAHHSQTMGSLVLLDPSGATEGEAPMTRLTPEVPFPEIEGWPLSYYASPWPLSERFYLVTWGCEGSRVPGPQGWNRWHAVQRPSDGMALYLFDAATRSREILWADNQMTCGDPIPVRARPQPPVIASQLDPAAANEGRFLLTDVYQGLPGVPPGSIQSLRLVAIPAKTHPTMNFPELGITHDDPGKCVLGTVPVEPDGSAYFRAPSGLTLFFQALDDRGIAVQTMRSATHAQPGQTLSCIGCHERRQLAPPPKPVLAASRPPSRITPGPEGSWPFRFDQLVQPVLDAHCVACHHPAATNTVAARFNLTPPAVYQTLIAFGKPSLRDLVTQGYARGFSIPGAGIAANSALLALLDAPQGHHRVLLDAESRERLLTWMDAYAQRLGHFSDEQERQLIELRRACANLLLQRPRATTAALSNTPPAPSPDGS